MSCQKKLNYYYQRITAFYQGECIIQAMMDFQNIFIHQPTFNMLKYKSTITEYVISWKSEGVFNSKYIQLNSDFYLT